MSSYENGWCWSDTATEDQTEDPQNEAAIQRLYQELVQIYRSIPDPQDEIACERYADYLSSLEPDEQDKAIALRKKKIADAWGQIEAIESLMSARGAELKGEYDHWNEDADRIRMMES